MFEKTFVAACLAGEALLDSIDDYIEYWHTHETGSDLHEFLGMTPYEYAQWLKSGEDIVLRDILEAREEEIPYDEYQALSDERRIAARSRKEGLVLEIKNNPGGNFS